MNKSAALLIGLILTVTCCGCVNLPMWKVPTPRTCQKVENKWGDAVDFVGHQSPIDKPWRDPRYCKRGIYRVGPYGVFEPVGEPIDDHPPIIEAPHPVPVPIY